MAEKDNARIDGRRHCRDCNWPIVFICCNIPEKPYSEWDWWLYCSKPTCKNHVGEGVFQDTPTWCVVTAVD